MRSSPIRRTRRRLQCAVRAKREPRRSAFNSCPSKRVCLSSSPMFWRLRRRNTLMPSWCFPTPCSTSTGGGSWRRRRSTAYRPFTNGVSPWKQAASWPMDRTLPTCSAVLRPTLTGASLGPAQNRGSGRWATDRRVASAEYGCGERRLPSERALCRPSHPTPGRRRRIPAAARVARPRVAARHRSYIRCPCPVQLRQGFKGSATVRVEVMARSFSVYAAAHRNPPLHATRRNSRIE